jgi:hypothetical protein
VKRLAPDEVALPPPDCAAATISASRLRCRPSASKFAGSNQASKARRIIRHIASVAAVEAWSAGAKHRCPTSITPLGGSMRR